MKQKKIKAIFRGKNGSCGFVVNTQYYLSIAIIKGLIVVESMPTNVNLANKCEYSSMLTFLDNWDCVRVVGDESNRYIDCC